MLESGFEFQFGLEFWGFTRWQFVKLVLKGFSGYPGFLPSFIGEWFQLMK